MQNGIIFAGGLRLQDCNAYTENVRTSSFIITVHVTGRTLKVTGLDFSCHTISCTFTKTGSMPCNVMQHSEGLHFTASSASSN